MIAPPAAVRRLFCAVLLSVSLLAGPALARNAPDSFAPLVKRVLPAVVNIAVTENAGNLTGRIPPELRGTPFERQLRERFGSRQTIGAGSGFIIDAGGTIVTNRHVVGRADRIMISLSDGTELPAKLIGSDELTDIAVLKVNASKPLPFVNFGDSRQVEVGDWILAAGNPFGLGGSVSAGIVSARGRDLGNGPFDDFLQLDAPINPGNSGGPTFNMDGEVVGINTAIVSPSGGSVGIGFAIPSEVVARIVHELRDKGRIERGWIGVALGDIEGPGVAIANVDRSGPAARAGLRTGDVVTAVNGEKVDTAREMIRRVAGQSPGVTLTLTLRRQGRESQLPVTIARRPGARGED